MNRDSESLSVPKTRFGLVLVCVWLLILMLQSAWVARFALQIMTTESLAHDGLYMPVLIVEIASSVLIFIALVMLIKILRPISVYYTILVILFCYPIRFLILSSITDGQAFNVSILKSIDLMGWTVIYIDSRIVYSAASIGFLLFSDYVSRRYGTQSKSQIVETSSWLWRLARGR